MRKGYRILCVLTLLAAALPAGAPRGHAAESRVFVHEVPDEATFNLYSKVMGADRFGKFVIDLKTDEIYFFDVNLYRLHIDFVFGVFYRRAWKNSDINEFNKNYDAKKPRFIFGYLTHHQKIDQWTYSFWEGDEITADDIRKVRKKLEATFFKKGMAWRPDSPMQEKKLSDLKDITTTTNDKIYKAATYQAFNKGKATGKLRIVPPGTDYETLIFDRDEIVILQEIYPDISPVSGILSTQFSTPLSHVNLRAQAWDIPNASYKKAVEKYKKLDGKMVVLEVRDLDHTLREATTEEVEAWKEAKKAAKTVKIPSADLTVTELRGLGSMVAEDAKIYGTKAANLGEIVSGELPGVNVPDGFGIPFSFYVAHMKKNKLDAEVEKLLTDERFAKDAAWRKTALEELRAKIIKAPMDKKTLSTIYKKVKKDLKGKGVFVRSSTNAEDLEGFNGAGLYDTVPNVKGEKQLGEAIKTVWASLWNFRAVEERELFSIDHRSCYPGVLVQIGVNASSAGVLITKNLFDREDDRSYTINAKRGLGLRVVGGTTIPEQIIYDTGNFGTKIISRSDDPTMLVFDDKGGVVEVPTGDKGVILTEERAKALSQVVEKFVGLFPPRYPLDVEWVIEGEKVWIVQARPYVAK